ncbi:MAG TPA: hypothetical protein DEG17_04105 [Cyanobacteria bacterium UBA11149]|nr:hypothetical protein [Cyanobacteria bacterium UBA11367]HBE59555.1 hypothetical protein [Cyanobacteria bacterium UBA11366]HBK65364.1 hypothetical protein [Cyanobacteria bacterium UBA11166]HBR75051.1 hypothetical protein [Cyanobacteria bacterium UBA11159]HBS68053.1 hypothetical protein [Cyanobacteria bacterium UBA11153]HBW88074.1 hypothetical protein [Cyanobacteria bacterium UBA11149]HCA95273.1 hypothetical protein [Cyanobacteria bacterium UBA9226]
MVIKYLDKYLTTPTTQRSNSGIFWFSLSLSFAALYGFFALQEAFSADFVVQDDVRQHVFWMRRFLDPDLFPNDLIANYYQSIAPGGFAALYRLIAKMGMDPLIFSKLLPPILALSATAYCFGCVMEILPIPMTGFIATLLLNQNLWIKDDISSATSRAFLYPLFLAFLYYLLRRSWLPLCVTIILEVLFYPPYVLMSVGLLFVRLWRFDKGRLRLSQDRSNYWFFAIGFVVAIAGLLPTILESSEFGGTITGTQARTMLEFSQNGRSKFFLDNPWEFWFFGERSGFFPIEWKTMNHNYFMLMFFAGLSLPILQRYHAIFPLAKQIEKEVFILLQIGLTSLGWFLLAHATLFKLYLPSRYSQHSLRIVMALSAAIALTLILDALFHACQELSVTLPRIVSSLIMPSLALGITALLSAILLIYPLFWKDFMDIGYIKGKDPELYQFFQQQPKDILIASIVNEARNLPSFTQRSVLTAREYAIPYHLGYYTQIRQRTIDLIQAQYSPEIKELKNFIHKYDIDFWVLDNTAFTPTYLQENRRDVNQVWVRQYQPAVNNALAQLQEGNIPALAKITPRCTALQTSNFIVIDTDCILQESS